MPTTSAEARERLIEALHADLVGPFDARDEEGANEVLPLPPSRWYLTGFLASAGAAGAVVATENEAELDPAVVDAELGAGDDIANEDEGDPDPESKRPGYFPSSCGLSLLLPPAAAERSDALTVTVRWADYIRLDPAADEAGAHSPSLGPGDRSDGSDGDDPRRRLWRRLGNRRETVTLPLNAGAGRAARLVAEVPDSAGLRLEVFVTPADAPGLEPGVRAAALFLVNGRELAAPGRQDESYVFQVGLGVRASCGLVARPDLRDGEGDGWDARVADLQYREACEWAVGHGVAVEATSAEDAREVPGHEVRTTWIPRATVAPVDHHAEPAVETRMEALGALDDGAAVEAALRPLVEAYGAWIAARRATDVGNARRAETRDGLMDAADEAKRRIGEGIDRLVRDPVAREAFARANRAMALAARKRSPERYPAEGDQVPRWRLFQLAFVVLNLEGIADDRHSDRETVELIYFPTGGGKTEAYLGVIAFTLLLRRLRGRDRPDQGLGVAVILRYTLRLLTLDQLGRAATLICALEQQRVEAGRASGRKGSRAGNPLGEARFAIGLWVGRSATANTMSQVARDMAKGEGGKASVFPLSECPWCGETIEERGLQLEPSVAKPERVVVSCTRWTCEFSRANSDGAGLPVLFVDEQIYRELPSFVVATVDKYAMTPWRGEVGMLFGRALARRGERFYGALDVGSWPVDAEVLPKGLVPPELIVQDELHLISGPLGTMTGLYETAIEYLTRYVGEDGRARLPKIIASTATVRESRRHVQALFGRRSTSVFPPPGIDANETFFSKVARIDEGVDGGRAGVAGRDYVGVAASGRRMKQVLLRTYVALLAAGARWYRPPKRGRKGADGGDEGGAQAVDPYLTLVGYFNSLRELGGMRRLTEDEVRTRCSGYAERVPASFAGVNPHFADRVIDMPLELTSRESTRRVKEAKDRLHRARSEAGGVDVLLASNMISVGVDIDRLGLMVVAGQPKSTAEYIQATSRVGRDRRRPGLVVTCLNLYKARDRSHYEHFASYHDSFYRHVEAGSLTPFSGPALDRGVAGVLVGMYRHTRPELTPPAQVMAIRAHRDGVGEQVVRAIVERATRTCPLDQAAATGLETQLRARLEKLLDSWEQIVATAVEAAADRCYSRYDRGGPGRALLFSALDALREAQPGQQLRSNAEKRFLAPTSMRDVEPSVHIYVDRPPSDEDTRGE